MYLIKIIRKEGSSKQALGEAFLSADPAVRRKAYNTVNLAAKEFSDKLLAYSRNRHVNLSSFAGNQSSIGQNTPGTIVFGDADRQVVDLSWANLFTFQDNRGVPDSTFLIEDVYNAIEFREYVPGSPVDIGNVQNDRNRFEYRLLAGGFQYENPWEEDYPYWQVADGMAAMNTVHAHQLEQIAISTITAAGGIAVSYQTGATALDQDIATINEGTRAILSAVYSDTRPDGAVTKERVARPVFVLLYNEFATGMLARINRAIAAGFGTPNDVIGGRALNYTVLPMPTPYISGTSWNLVLPGRKNVWALKNDLQIFPHFDPFAAGGVSSRIGHGRIGSVRGDANQVAALATS